MRGGSFSFIFLVKLLNYKSAIDVFLPTFSSQLHVWVRVSVR